MVVADARHSTRAAKTATPAMLWFDHAFWYQRNTLKSRARVVGFVAGCGVPTNPTDVDVLVGHAVSVVSMRCCSMVCSVVMVSWVFGNHSHYVCSRCLVDSSVCCRPDLS